MASGCVTGIAHARECTSGTARTDVSSRPPGAALAGLVRAVVLQGACLFLGSLRMTNTLRLQPRSPCLPNLCQTRARPDAANCVGYTEPERSHLLAAEGREPGRRPGVPFRLRWRVVSRGQLATVGFRPNTDVCATTTFIVCRETSRQRKRQRLRTQGAVPPAQSESTQADRACSNLLRARSSSRLE